MPEPLDYTSPTTEGPPHKRSAGKWVVLIIVWIAGLVTWTIYLIMAGYLLLRFL